MHANDRPKLLPSVIEPVSSFFHSKNAVFSGVNSPNLTLSNVAGCMVPPTVKFKFKFKIFFIASYYINGQEIWTYDTYNQDFFSGAHRRMADLITLCKALVLCWISTVRAHSQSGNPSQPDFLKCILFIRLWHNAAQVWLTQNVNNNRSKGSGKPDKVYGLL